MTFKSFTGAEDEHGHKSVRQIVQIVWSLTDGFHRIIWLLVGMGVLASLAETIGITVLVSLIFMQMSGQNDTLAALTGAPLWLRHMLGTNISLPAIIAILLGTVITKLLLSVGQGMLTTRVTNLISEKIRQRLFNQLLDVSLNDIRSHDRSELLTVLDTDSYCIANAYGGLVTIGVNLASMAIFGTALILLSWQLAAIAIIGGALHMLLVRLFSRRSSRIGIERADVVERMTNMVWTTLQAIRSIRCFGIQSPNKEKFTVVSQRVTRLLIQSDNIGHQVSVISETVMLAILVVVLLAATHFGITMQSVLAATALLYRLQPHVRGFDRERLYLHEWGAPIRRTYALLRSDDKTYLPAGHLPYTRVGTSIDFNKVSYCYPGMTTPVINHLSFSIPGGKTTAIRGASGAGKSTVINMLLRLMTPDSGNICVDGVNLFDLRSPEWLRAVAVAGQDVELIEGTVRENIMMMRSGYSDEEMYRAAEIAGIADFIASLPGGYDEWLGDEALNISGGQRQRVGLARALVGDPDVLILDEALNALDDTTERQVLSNIRDALPGRTIVFISHRPIKLLQIDHTITLRA